jgi:hypothetical protein
MKLKLSNFAGPALSAWIVALAAIGSLALLQGGAASDEARVPRPPAADVSVAAPAMRDDGSEGTSGMLPFAYDLDEWELPGGKPLPALVDAES